MEQRLQHAQKTELNFLPQLQLEEQNLLFHFSDIKITRGEERFGVIELEKGKLGPREHA